MKTNRPFTVPEGYFEQLTERVMSNIPANEVRMLTEKAPEKRFRWHRYAAAAAVAAAIFGAGLFFGHSPVAEPKTDAPVAVANHANSTPDAAYGGDFDNVADYIMCDDYDLYAYLTSE
jgi:hypothetical protein